MNGKLTKLAKMWNEGAGPAEIGRALGLTRGVVSGKIDRMIKAGDARIRRGAADWRPWTDKESLDLLHWRERLSMEWRAIGTKLHRTARECFRHYKDIIRDLEASERG